MTGLIKKVNTDTAIFWEECNICGSFDLHSITKENIKCRTCLTENIATVLKYTLELEIQTNNVDTGQAITAVKVRNLILLITNLKVFLSLHKFITIFFLIF